MSIEKHNADYKNDGKAHLEYTVEELQWWVRLLRKRAGMRTDEAKRAKDLYDANNYEQMLRSRGG